MSKKLCALACAAVMVVATASPLRSQELLDTPICNPASLDRDVNHVGFLSDRCTGGDSEDAWGCGTGVGKKKPANNPCAGSHKGLFYANDFRYLNDPCYKGCCLGDSFKLMPVANGDWGTLDLGGQMRLRYHHEHGMGRQAGRSGFEDTDNDFLLTRLRLYSNWKVNDYLRLYGEGIFAYVSANDAYIPRPIDQNSADFLNLFFDMKLMDSATVRVGRQELLYGAQRTISPLDWANTRRTFEGARVLTKHGDWAVDGFYTAFVPVQPFDFDVADWKQPFYGIYASNSDFHGKAFDVYYLGFDNRNPATSTNPATPGAGAADFSLHTFGARMTGPMTDLPFLFDFEGAYQCGRQSGLGLDQAAGFVTYGVGKQFEATWSPTVWLYYDYASGNTLGGDFNRYNQLFPLAHKYLGFIDAVARSNISAPNVLVTMAPTKKINLLCWYYYFGADQASDFITPVATPSVQNLTSSDFGNELDLLARYGMGPRSNLILGYSHLWRGSKIIGTDDASFFYGQWEMNF